MPVSPESFWIIQPEFHRQLLMKIEAAWPTVRWLWKADLVVNDFRTVKLCGLYKPRVAQVGKSSSTAVTDSHAKCPSPFLLPYSRLACCSNKSWLEQISHSNVKICRESLIEVRVECISWSGVHITTTSLFPSTFQLSINRAWYHISYSIVASRSQIAITATQKMITVHTNT